MKLVWLLFSLSTNFQFQTIQGCRQDCVDYSSKCITIKQFCTKDLTKTLCPYTCRTCIPCFTLRPALSICEVGTCTDLYSSGLCYFLKAKSYGCLIFRSNCRATCGLCQGCYLPPSEILCTDDCTDNHKSCKYWKKRGYCSIRKGFPHVITVCPLSCGRCVRCPTKKPNTALPPTKAKVATKKSSVFFTTR